MKKYLTSKLSYIMGVFSLLLLLVSAAYQYVASRTSPLYGYKFIVTMPLDDYIEHQQEILTVLAEREGVLIWQGKQTDEVVLAFRSFSMYAKGIKSFSPDSKTYSYQAYTRALWQRGLLLWAMLLLVLIGCVAIIQQLAKLLQELRNFKTKTFLLL